MGRETMDARLEAGVFKPKSLRKHDILPSTDLENHTL